MRRYFYLALAAAVFAVFISEDAAFGRQDEAGGAFSLSVIVVPLGVSAVCFIATTFLTGIFRRKFGRRFLKIHLFLAVASVVLGLLHGLLVFALLD